MTLPLADAIDQTLAAGRTFLNEEAELTNQRTIPMVLLLFIGSLFAPVRGKSEEPPPPPQTTAEEADAQPAEEDDDAEADAREGEARPGDPEYRDPVVDLNGPAVRAGDFPGSIKIPGTGNISLAVDRFVNAALLVDFEAEGKGADFLPATLGTTR